MKNVPVFLIVQPNKDLRRQLEDWLRIAMPDTLIVTAKDGAQALRLAAYNRPTFGLVEIHLEDQSGLIVIRQIHEIVPDARIFASSFSENNNLQLDVIKAGAVGFITHDHLYLELLPSLRVNGYRCER